MIKYLSVIKMSLVFFAMLLVACSSQTNKVTTAFKYSIEKPTEGQLYTAKRLKILMSDKKYEEAITLFSKKQQSGIKEIQENTEMFNYWCLAWALDDRAYKDYCSRIKNGGGQFVFEENVWKIDEK